MKKGRERRREGRIEKILGGMDRGSVLHGNLFSALQRGVGQLCIKYNERTFQKFWTFTVSLCFCC